MKSTTARNGLLLLVAAGLVTAPARADSFRCNGDLMRPGMEAKQIRDKCGPASLTRIKRKPMIVQMGNGRSVRRGTEITVYWYYDRGPNHFVARVTIRGPTVDAIDILDVKSIGALRE
jgi:hypothetical protein